MKPPPERAQPKPPPESKPQIAPHRHELEPHDHDLPSHDHPEFAHEHPHDHQVPPHEHPVPAHEHRDVRGQLVGAVRALLTVFEGGAINTRQRKALHNVRVVIGDAHGTGCPHETANYEAGDVLVCQDCREALPSPDAAG